MLHIKVEYPKELGVTMGYSGGYVSFSAQKPEDIRKLIIELERSLVNEWDRLFPYYFPPWKDA